MRFFIFYILLVKTYFFGRIDFKYKIKAHYYQNWLKNEGFITWVM